MMGQGGISYAIDASKQGSDRLCYILSRYARTKGLWKLRTPNGEGLTSPLLFGSSLLPQGLDQINTTPIEVTNHEQEQTRNDW